jgi:uncharacterized membrane protein
MEPLLVLATALLAFRLLGRLGAGRLATWPAAAAHALAAMLVLTASAHFVPAGVAAMPNHGDLVNMVPPFVPFPGAVVYATGVLELLGVLGLVLAATRRPAGLALAALFVLLLPANVYAAVAGVPFHGGAAAPLWLRVPEQALYVAAALWVAAAADPAPARRVPASLCPRPRSVPATPLRVQPRG